MAFSNLFRLTAAIAALLAGAVVSTPAAKAVPNVCMQLAWAECDPQFARLTPEWQQCFGAFYDACQAGEAPPPPNYPPTPPPWKPD